MKTLNTILFIGALSLINPSEINCQKVNNTINIINYKKNQSLDKIIKNFRLKGFKIEELFSDPRFEIYGNIDKIFKGSPESRIKDYNVYKEKLGVENKKKKIGKFIRDYNYQLSIAEKQYNIPKEIIASIIGVESDFGNNTGKYYAFNSFISLIVKDYKTDFALIQLEHLLKFSKKNNINVFGLKSSYAGAIGFAQFIPSSLNQYFVGDNVYDMEDNINSVANYLKSAKKRTGKLDRAVYAYNHSDFYVRAVLEIAEAGKE